MYRKAARDHAQGKPLCLRVIGELVPQPVKQIVDRETDHFGVDSAGLDLVYVEQRVQHARHGAQRLVEPCDQLLRSSRPRRSSPAAPAAGRAFAAAGAGHGSRRRETAISRHWPAPPAALAASSASAMCLPLGDVGKGDDDALDPVVLGAVRQYAADVPGAALSFDLPLDRREGLQHRSGIRQKSAIGGQRAEVCERPPDVAGNDIEERLGGRREEADIEVGVEEERRNIGAVQDILQIIGGRTLPLQRFLELAVEGGKLLVERLQFLLRRQQLLVRRLVFLVDGQCFFVDRLLLFARNLKVADGALQLRSAWLRVPARARRPAERLPRAVGATSLCAPASARRRSKSTAAPRPRSEPAVRRC